MHYIYRNNVSGNASEEFILIDDGLTLVDSMLADVSKILVECCQKLLLVSKIHEQR